IQKRFVSHDLPIMLNSIDEYVDYNSEQALKIDYMYRNLTDLTSKFYLTAIKSITLSQKSTAGCMIMFFKDLLYM
ncbi:hypothetical protein CHF27_010340, partial [Romboutsia maritimum]